MKKEIKSHAAIPGRVSYGSFTYAPIWTSKDGRSQYIEEMPIEHVFYAARMIYNHSVPPAFRVLRAVEDFNFQDAIKAQPQSVRRGSYESLAAELQRRHRELPAPMARQFTDMRENRDFLRMIQGEPPALVG